MGAPSRINGWPNNLTVAVNREGYGARSSEVRKRGGNAVFPSLRRNFAAGAGSRVAYSLTFIVDAEWRPRLARLSIVGRAYAMPLSHITGRSTRLFVMPGGRVESTTPFSA